MKCHYPMYCNCRDCLKAMGLPAPKGASREDRLANLALTMGLTVSQTIALPLAIQNAAQKVGMTEERFTSELERIQELRDYVKQACVKAGAVLEG